MGRPARLLPIPPAMLHAAGYLLGRGKEIDRLLGSLTVTSAFIRQRLGWIPPHTLEEGLCITVQGFLHEKAV